MADPVSLLGTVPALATLPAVSLQAVHTIHNFCTSLKNAPADVRQLLKETEAIQTLIQNVRAQCDQATAQVENGDLQHVIGLINERMEAPLKKLRELRAGMEKPSRSSKLKSRVQKYFSEDEINEHLNHLSPLMAALQLLHEKTNVMIMQQLCSKIDAMQHSMNLLLLRPSNPIPSALPLPATNRSQHAVSLDTFPGTTRSRGSREKSRCMKGLCKCPCHRISNYQRSWLVSAQTACLVACGCSDRMYQWTLSLFGKLITFKAGFRENGQTSIGWNITPLRTVPRTSPGFVVIRKCMVRTLTASEASRDLRVLLSSGVISTKDQNPDGQSYIDFLLTGPWAFDAGSQFELLKTLAHDGFIWESDKLLRRLLKWIGEGPHMHLLKSMISLFDFTQGFQPETMAAWPEPFSAGFLDIFTYPDVLFITVIAELAAEDPEFGGTTQLQAAVLLNNIDAVKAVLSQGEPSNLFYRNFRGQCALHLAIRNPRTVSLLLDAGASSQVDLTDEHGMTPLIYAAAYGVVESTKVLLMAGADPYHRADLTGMCMWHYALHCQETEFLQEILGFYMTRKTEMASSALESCLAIRLICHHAYSNDISCRTLEYLIEIQSRRPKSCYENFSLLHLCRDLFEARLLLTHCCDGINEQNHRGYTPMMVLSHLPASADVLRMSVEQTGDVRILDSHRMSALHHLNASMIRRSPWAPPDKEEWTNWLDATAVLLSAGGDINQGDKCSCPCSSSGCSPLRGLFWDESELFSSRKRALQAIPWIVELLLVLKHSGQQMSLAQAISDIHRYQTFEEWGMTHTCCIHSQRLWRDGPRPEVYFHRPCEDFQANQDECNIKTSGKESEDWDSEFIEITNEQDESARLLEAACMDYNEMLSGAIEDQFIGLLARRVVLLEHQLESLAKEKIERLRKTPNFGPEPPPKELLISEHPLQYIDKKTDTFVGTSISFETSSASKTYMECKFEHHYNIFVDGFSTNSHTYAYMSGQTRQAWDAERKQLLLNLYQEVLHLRSTSLEKRGWDVDLIQVYD